MNIHNQITIVRKKVHTKSEIWIEYFHIQDPVMENFEIWI